MMNSETTTYRRLGDYIRQVDVRNRDLKVTNLVGLSVNKIFIPSIANTIGTDMAPYKIVRNRQFAYVADTSRRGDKIGIALYENESPGICSTIYTVFEVIDESAMLPKYLMMWFRRPEFDRYSRFKSHGSAREIFDWEEMCDVMLPVPPIEEQREIVARHKAIEHKIDVNLRIIAKLEETARTIYRHTFVENIDPENLPEHMYLTTILGFCKEIKSGGTPNRSNAKFWSTKKFRWLKTGEVHNCIIHDTEEYISQEGLDYSSAKLIEKDSIIMAMYGATAAQVGYLDCESTTNQACCNMTCFSKEQAAYLYFHLLAKQDEIRRLANGGAQENLSQEIIANQPIIGVYDNCILRPFESIINQIIPISKENGCLLELLNSMDL